MPDDNGLLQEFVSRLLAWVTDSRKVFFHMNKKIKEQQGKETRYFPHNQS